MNIEYMNYFNDKDNTASHLQNYKPIAVDTKGCIQTESKFRTQKTRHFRRPIKVPSRYLHGGVRATAVISPVGLVHPNIHMSFNRKVVETADLPLMTAAFKMVRPSPEARYRSLRTPSWSCAKKLIASSERKATSRYLGLHWR